MLVGSWCDYSLTLSPPREFQGSSRGNQRHLQEHRGGPKNGAGEGGGGSAGPIDHYWIIGMIAILVLL